MTLQGFLQFSNVTTTAHINLKIPQTHSTNIDVIYLILHINKKLCVSNIDDIQNRDHAYIVGRIHTTYNYHFVM